MGGMPTETGLLAELTARYMGEKDVRGNRHDRQVQDLNQDRAWGRSLHSSGPWREWEEIVVCKRTHAPDTAPQCRAASRRRADNLSPAAAIAPEGFCWVGGRGGG